MNNFEFYYQGRGGTMWYRCANCGYLTRGKPIECPVCQGYPIPRQDDGKEGG